MSENTTPTTYGEKVAAADAARTPLDDQPKPDIDQLMLQIPARRWLAIRRAMDATSTEILNDIVMQLVVAANEQNRAGTGRDDWDRFLNLGFTDLSLFLGLITQADVDKAGSGPKSDGRAVEPHDDADGSAAVGAAGGRDDVPEGEGPLVPGHRPDNG